MIRKTFDEIHIKDLSLRCIIGINEEERREKQDVIINIIMYCNIKKAGLTDNIKDTVDYKEIKKKIVKMVESSSFFLIEKLAEEIANICLSNTKIKKVEVTVDKPNALRFAKSVAVKIVRKRG